MSIRKRQKRASRPNFRVLSRKEERKIARIKKSGLSVKMAEPRAGEKIRVSRAQVKTLVSDSEEKASKSNVPDPDPELELDDPITVGSMMPEVEEELAKWAREEEASESDVPDADAELELDYPITVGSLMPEVEDELAQWAKEEEEQW